MTEKEFEELAKKLAEGRVPARLVGMGDEKEEKERDEVL